MRVGPMAVGTLAEWEPTLGKAVTWQPSPTSSAKARQAPVSAVPISYIQDQHLRGYCEQKAKGLDYSRLMIISCDVPGRCDVRAMTYVINAHLRRHDSYRSWFEYTASEQLIRHTMDNAADIQFVPTDHGEVTLAELRKLAVSTPDPLQWGCFQFGVVQGEDHFTFYASVDHVHVDTMLIGVILVEFYLMYSAVVGGNAPLALPAAGSYDEFCVRQRNYTSALTLESPEVRTWIEFAENNNGGLPDFPLPLGDPLVPSTADIVTIAVLDAQQTARFETFCTDAGARFIGGVFACTGYAETNMSGAGTYYGLTPSDTRSSPTDAATQGWFTGLVPVTVPIAGSSFGDAARAAQASYDSCLKLASVPYQHVVELAPWLHKPQPNFPVLNLLDASVAPLSTLLTPQLTDVNIGVYSDSRYSYQLCLYVIRVPEATAVAMMFPDNPVAQESVVRYLEALKSVFTTIADSGRWPTVGRDAYGSARPDSTMVRPA